MPRFYCPQPLGAGATIELPEAVAHHLHVVRMQPGDALTLFDEHRIRLSDWIAMNLLPQTLMGGAAAAIVGYSFAALRHLTGEDLREAHVVAFHPQFLARQAHR